MGTLNAESQDEKNAQLVGRYKEQVEAELKDICKDVLALLEQSLINKDAIQQIMDTTDSTEVKVDSNGEAQVFYLKMAGDYFRYLAEAVTLEKHEESAAEYYKKAFNFQSEYLNQHIPFVWDLPLIIRYVFMKFLRTKRMLVS